MGPFEDLRHLSNIARESHDIRHEPKVFGVILAVGESVLLAVLDLEARDGSGQQSGDRMGDLSVLWFGGHTGLNLPLENSISAVQSVKISTTCATQHFWH